VRAALPTAARSAGVGSDNGCGLPARGLEPSALRRAATPVLLRAARPVPLAGALVLPLAGALVLPLAGALVLPLAGALVLPLVVPRVAVAAGGRLAMVSCVMTTPCPAARRSRITRAE